MRFLDDSEPAMNEINSKQENSNPDAFRQKLASMVTAIIIVLCAIAMVAILLGKE